ncbi:dATP/dGTP pyrophosphohydrolase domain-containing protein [Spongiimicrobium salis]|uniref:dATP/dGTP pyrophosphohydrolase domain-containing protein n=1 Tax=Spongiimicrobium salis TaxID=1667022 RepID=UPI00374D748A
MNKQQFEEISKWQEKTFGKATSLSKMAHLKQEIIELEKELIFWNQNKESFTHTEANKITKQREFADCFILLFGAAASDGMTYEEICNCIEEKMQINYSRKWGEPNKNGVVNHIK